MLDSAVHSQLASCCYLRGIAVGMGVPFWVEIAVGVGVGVGAP
jgi:hypothetical protein